MKLFTLWVADENDASDAFLLDAWDEGSIDENPEGWEQKVCEAKNEYKAHRIIKVSIPSGDVSKAFAATAITGKVVEK